MTTIQSQVELPCGIERAFDLLRSIQAHVASSHPTLQCRVESASCTGLPELGDTVTWSAVFWGLRFRLTTKVTECAPPYFYSEKRIAGMMRHFGHDYYLTALSREKTSVNDHFSFACPVPVLGLLGDTWVLRPKFAALARYRLEHLQLLAQSIVIGSG